MANTLTSVAYGPQTGTFCRSYRLQGASADTTADSVTIALTNLGIANSTDASARFFWSQKDLDAASALMKWYEVSNSGTSLVVARVQLASSPSNCLIQTQAIHSLVF